MNKILLLHLQVLRQNVIIFKVMRNRNKSVILRGLQVEYKLHRYKVLLKLIIIMTKNKYHRVTLSVGKVPWSCVNQPNLNQKDQIPSHLCKNPISSQNNQLCTIQVLNLQSSKTSKNPQLLIKKNLSKMKKKTSIKSKTVQSLPRN